MEGTVEQRSANRRVACVPLRAEDRSLQKSPSPSATTALGHERELTRVIEYCRDTIATQYEKWARNCIQDEEPIRVCHPQSLAIAR